MSAECLEAGVIDVVPERLVERMIGNAGNLQAPSVQDGPTGGVDVPGNLRHQRCLADARLTAHQGDLTVTTCGEGNQSLQLPALVGATDEGGAGLVECAHQRDLPVDRRRSRPFERHQRFGPWVPAEPTGTELGEGERAVPTR